MLSFYFSYILPQNTDWRAKEERVTFDIDIKDTISSTGETGTQFMPTTYKQRVLEYLDENIDAPVLQKIYKLE